MFFSLRSKAPLLLVFAFVGLSVSLPLGCGAHSAPKQAPSSGPTAPGVAQADASPPAVGPPEPPSELPTGPANSGVVAPHALVVQTAREVLERGGHAVDAAVAAELVAAVVLPEATGLGGGGVGMVVDAGEVRAFDYLSRAPIGLRPSHFATPSPAWERRGIAVAVPGLLAGLFTMHARYGRLPFADLVAPAIAIAESGATLNVATVRALDWNREWFARSPDAAVWGASVDAIAIGDQPKLPALAAALRRIADDGPAALYGGPLGKHLVESAREAGSRMIESDLTRYEVIEREPLEGMWDGQRLFAFPAPSAGGLLCLQALSPSAVDVAVHELGSGTYLHILAETFRGSIADRMRFVGDPEFIKPRPGLLDAERLAKRAARISLSHTQPAPSFPFDEPGTSFVIVLDPDGNAAVLTSTLRQAFGARVITQDGIVLNDTLSDFTRPPLSTKFGRTPGPNAPRGDARPVTSMTPLIVLDDDGVRAAFAASGGERIPTSIVQVFLARFAFDAPPERAVAIPRVHPALRGGLWVDEELGPARMADLRARGEVIDGPRLNFGSVGLVERTPSGIVAELDPRRGGGSAEAIAAPPP